MTVVSIVLVLIFSIVLCVIEIPKMRQEKLIKELWAFSILLLIGVTLVILKTLDIPISNPSDWIAWVYSPISDFLKIFLK